MEKNVNGVSIKLTDLQPIGSQHKFYPHIVLMHVCKTGCGCAADQTRQREALALRMQGGKK